MRISTGCLLVVLLLLAGCGRKDSNSSVWVARDAEHQGAEVSLGYAMPSGDETGRIIPLAKVVENEAARADAMVFVTPLAADGTPIGAEVPTRYDASSGSGEAVFRGDPLRRNDSIAKLQFRIVLPEGETTREVELEATATSGS